MSAYVYVISKKNSVETEPWDRRTTWEARNVIGWFESVVKRFVSKVKFPRLKSKLENNFFLITKTGKKPRKVFSADCDNCLKEILVLHFVSNEWHDEIYLYRSGTVNSNKVNSKFHLIRSFFEILARILSFHV